MEILGITLTSWVALLNSLSFASLAGIMFILGKERLHYIWGLFCLATALWAGSFYIVTLQDNPASAHFWWKITYIGIISVPFIFLHFVLEFINNDKLNKHKSLVLAGLYASLGFLLFLDLTSNVIIGGVNFLFNELYYSAPGLLHPYFTCLYLTLVCFAFYLVYREYNLKYNDSNFRIQSSRFMFATLFGFAGASLNFLAVYGVYVHPITNLTAVIGSVIVTDTILRYRLFNIRVAFTQILAFTLVAITIIRLTISTESRDLLINIFQVFSTLAIAIYLLLSTRKEIEQREKIENLAKQLEISNAGLKNLNTNLQEKVDEQTKEIRNSYEIEKKAHEELSNLNRNKNDFIIVTQHHLRTPLTQIRWYISSILSGLYGDITPDLERALNSIGKSSEKLTKTLNNFLDISELKIGTQLLNKSPTNLKNLIDTVIEENLKEIKRRKINVSIDQSDSSWPVVQVDMDRMKEVFSILIDNAIRYNKEGGDITISTSQDKKSLKVTISNSGPTLSDLDREKVFKQSFFRTKEAKELNPTGMGVSLLVAKTIVEAHEGNIKVESDTTKTSFLVSISTKI